MGMDFDLIGFKKKNSDGTWDYLEMPSYMYVHMGRRDMFEYMQDAMFDGAITELENDDECEGHVAMRYDLLERIKLKDTEKFNEILLDTWLGLVMNVLESIFVKYELKSDEACCVFKCSW